MRALIATGLIAVLSSLALSAETISGTVVIEETKQSIAGAAVTVTPTYIEGAAARTTADLAKSTKSDATGAFTFTGLAPGRYRICTSVNGSDLLPPCEWGYESQVAVMPGATAVTQVRLRRGREVQVRVADPGGLLDTNEKLAGSGVHLLVGAWQDTHFVPSKIRANDKTARIYSVVVPFDLPLKLAVRGENVNAQDAQGRAVAKDARIDINEPKSASRAPKTFDYAITAATPVGTRKP